MNKEIDLVSIIIPAYNKSNYTKIAIESVLKQTYQNIELIVINDGSSDDTEIMLKNINDLKLRKFNIKNSGACAARNIGIKKSQGKYIAFLDCDDTYEIDKIEKSVNFLKLNLNYKFVYTDVNFIDKNGYKVGQTKHFSNHPGSGNIAIKLIKCDYNITNSTLLLEKNCIEKTGLFDEKIFIPADREFLIRLANEFKGGYLKSNLTNYRVNNETIYKNLDLALDEFIYMINKFNNTSIISSNRLYKICLSNIYYNFSKMYAANKSIIKFRSLIIKSIKNNYLEKKILIKIIGLIISYLFPNKILDYFNKYNKYR